jgi:HD-like signal output (HDOD) protein
VAQDGAPAALFRAMGIPFGGEGDTVGQVRAAAPVGKKRIGDLLVEANLISSEMLRQALEAQRERGTKIVETLIHLGHLTVDDFVNFLSRQPGVASLDLRRYHVQREVVDLIPKDLAVKHEIFPVDRMGRLLTLAMACPLDSLTVGAIEEKTGLRVKPILCPAADIHAAIDIYYPGGKTFDEPGNKPAKKEEPKPAATKPAQTEPAKPAVAPAAAASAAPKAQQESEAEVAKARTGLMLTQTADLVRRLSALPVLPATVARVQEALGDVSISPKEVAQTISTDPALAVKVLSVANSPAYGFASQVQTIELAVALLGLRETYAIVLSAAVLNLFDVKKRFDYGHFWEEAMNTAGAARILARCCAKNKEGGAFTAGLLHDIGRIALLEVAPDLYAKVPARLAGDELTAAEHKVLGIAHAEAGYELAVHWSLPKPLALAIRHHHHPELAPECQQEAAVVALAEAWTREARLSGRAKKDVIKWADPLLKMLGLDARAAETAYDLVSRLPRAEFIWDPAAAKSAEPATA